jgi:NAD dependent epimerase/dehydratase family enzyme
LVATAGAYNVVEDDPVTRRVLGDTLATLLGVKQARPIPTWITRLFGSIGELMARSQRISNRKLREASDRRPRYSSVRNI